MNSNQPIEGGATLWARRTIESDVFLWKPDKWFKIWFYIVSRANYKDSKQFVRGEFHVTGAQIATATGASDDQIKKCLGWMRKSGMIDTQRSTRGTRIIVNNYGAYQDIESYRSTSGGTKEAREKHERSTTIDKKGNKGKKGSSNNSPESESNTIENNDPLLATSKDVAAQVNKVFEKFQMTELNTTISYGNNTQRQAAEFLIEKFKMPAIEKILDFLASEEVTKDPYAPRVTTPYQLKEKWGLIRQYYAKLYGKNEKNSITVIE